MDIRRTEENHRLRVLQTEPQPERTRLARNTRQKRSLSTGEPPQALAVGQPPVHQGRLFPADPLDERPQRGGVRGGRQLQYLATRRHFPVDQRPHGRGGLDVQADDISFAADGVCDSLGGGGGEGEHWPGGGKEGVAFIRTIVFNNLKLPKKH